MEIKLYKPIMVDGKEVKTLEPDFDSLNNGTMDRAQKFVQARNHIVVLAATDETYNGIVGALAAGLAPEDAWALHPKDMRRLAGETMAFFQNDSAES